VVLALGLVCAGAVGNLIDRAMLGRVTDFFEFGFVQFPVFNVADMAILTGVSILAFWILFGPQPDAEAESVTVPVPDSHDAGLHEDSDAPEASR
jgi:lipoprotein signal peptidase